MTPMRDHPKQVSFVIVIRLIRTVLFFEVCSIDLDDV
jgi:hypothetical protein